jgi:hypothetical protein
MSIGNITPTAGVASTSGPAGVGSTTSNRPNLHSVYQAGFASIASLLGETVGQLGQSMKGGQSLAQVLTAAGKTPEQGAEAFLAGIQSGVNSDLAAGTITSAQATSILATQTSRINTLLGASAPNPGLSTSTGTTTSGTGTILNAVA